MGNRKDEYEVVFKNLAYSSIRLKLNELLPDLIFDFWDRLNTTIKFLVAGHKEVS
ncbi:MAG: hypothetical protein JWR05_2619 [Mucilaginibacter sp.]|nr:hypothetical protein [Mucilaginibacter sp.]